VTVRIKVCGIIHPDDAEAAADAGADLIGINFVPSSPRRVDVRMAEAIAKRVEGRLERVALFSDPSWDEVERVTRRIDFERVQLHGQESEADVEMLDLPVIKAIRGADLEAAQLYPGALLLLDHPTEGGGRGQVWNWSDAGELIANGYDVILAGGLNPENVAQAIGDLGDLLPWGVDVATGVEGAEHRKDPKLLAAFVAAVRTAEKG
jgi:phosphoribosylanthranilate isomerase